MKIKINSTSSVEFIFVFSFLSSTKEENWTKNLCRITNQFNYLLSKNNVSGHKSCPVFHFIEPRNGFTNLNLL